MIALNGRALSNRATGATHLAGVPRNSLSDLAVAVRSVGRSALTLTSITW
jgi:hypothetical protein